MIDDDGPGRFVVDPLPAKNGVPTINNGYLPIPTPITPDSPQDMPSNSTRREHILQGVEHYGLLRPADNVERQLEEQLALWQEVIVEHEFENDD